MIKHKITFMNENKTYKILFSKKGDVSGAKFLLYILYSFLIMLSFVSFIGTLSALSARSAAVPENLEIMLIINRAFSSPECFAYQDETGRVYDIIDMNKFNDNALERCMILNNFPYDFKFELRIKEKGIIVDHLTGYGRIELEGIVENNYIAQTSGWFGISVLESFSIPVLVRKDTQLIPGNVRISRQRSSRLYK